MSTADVDAYIARHAAWSDGLTALRSILTSTELDETIKWGAPCYTFGGTNVVGLGAFRSYFGLWFHQGALLADRRGVLINAQEGKTKALRQWRFTSADEIRPRLVRGYVVEAIELAREGRSVAPARPSRLVLPPELERALSEHDARAAFDALSPGRRREYARYITEARRDSTKASRIEKILPMIEAGVGLNDRYRSRRRVGA